MTYPSSPTSAGTLAHTILNEGAKQYWMFLHGILGSRSNWRSIARQLLANLNEEDAQAWGAVLVDLRCHGESQDVPAPHSLEHAASDLRALCNTLARPVTTVLGHSFGGKVALALSATPPTHLRTFWVVDSQPGVTRPGENDNATDQVFALLRELPAQFSSRDAFVAHVVDRGQPKPLAQWLAMNLVPAENDENHWRLDLDLDALDALMEDYRNTNLWPLVETPPHPRTLQMVVGGRSPVLSSADQLRLKQALPETTHLIEHSGHWVHVDAPKELLAILQRGQNP